jgi:hypothetical protein
MAIIRKRIENLKAGKDYILSVQAKNSDLNTANDPLAAIRFTVPRDGTVPADIQNLQLRASYENVMFVFDFGQEEDISHYAYELYDANEATEANLVSAGINPANVFTISVANSSQAAGQSPVWRDYWGRVKAVDTSGNESNWTPLIQTDESTPLIDEQFISSLTASKITAGTIGAHTITLNGANSILQSSNFSTGSTGWQIKGDGTAEFDSQYIRGNLDAGSVTIGGGTYNYWNKTGAENDFRVGDDSTYVLWDNSAGTLTVAGDASISGTLNSADGTFTGTLSAVDGTFSGTLSGVGGTFTSNVVVGEHPTNKITIASDATDTGTKIYAGVGTYNNSNTGFYIDASGQFSLGNKLAFDQASGLLNLNGTPSGASSDLIIEGAIIRTVQDVDDVGSTSDGVVLTENDIFLYSRTTDESAIKFQGSTNNIAKIISEIKGIQLSATNSQGSPKFQIGTDNTSTENYLMYKWYGYSGAEAMTLYRNGSSNPNILDIKNNTSQIKVGSIQLKNEGTASDLSINWDEDTDSGIYRYNPGDSSTGVSLVAQGIQTLFAASFVGSSDSFVYMNTPTTTTTSGYSFLLRSNTYGTISNYTSSRDLKENITEVTDVGSFFDEVKPVTFVPKAPENETEDNKTLRLADIQHGFIAEDIAEIFDGRLATYDADLNPNGWRWPDMVAVCVAEIKSLRKRVAQLESM